MRCTTLVRTVGRLAAAVAILVGPLLPVGAGTATADGDEKPVIISWYPNAPGMITIEWVHSGEGVYWFVVEQEEPFAFWPTPHADTRIWSVSGLQPSTTYRYRVCAVYDFNRVCSDEDGVGYASITTLPPQQAQQPPPPQPAPPPQPKPAPPPQPAPPEPKGPSKPTLKVTNRTATSVSFDFSVKTDLVTPNDRFLVLRDGVQVQEVAPRVDGAEFVGSYTDPVPPQHAYQVCFTQYAFRACSDVELLGRSTTDVVDLGRTVPGSKVNPSAADLQVAELPRVEQDGGVAGCVAGKTNNVRVVIKNAGDEGANGFTMQLIVDQQPVATQTVGSAPARIDTTYYFGNVSLTKGLHTLQVRLDIENKVPEVDEDNNTSPPLTVVC